MKSTLALIFVLVGLHGSFAQTEWNKEVQLPSNEQFTHVRRISNLSGIGVIIKNDGGRFVVVEVLKGSGAEDAGLRVGDVLSQVDGKSILTLRLVEIAALLRGNPGTAVILKVERSGNKEPLELKATRHPVILPDSSEKEKTPR